MFEIIILIAWIIGIILATMWIFLPWIIISKIDEVIEELKELNEANRIKKEVSNEDNPSS